MSLRKGIIEEAYFRAFVYWGPVRRVEEEAAPSEPVGAEFDSETGAAVIDSETGSGVIGTE